MPASDFWARCAATVFVITAAIGGVIALITQAVPPLVFFIISGALIGLCVLFAIIAAIWE